MKLVVGISAFVIAVVPAYAVSDTTVLGARPLAEQDPITRLDVNWDELASFSGPARHRRDHRGSSRRQALYQPHHDSSRLVKQEVVARRSGESFKL